MQIISIEYQNEKGETIEHLPQNFADVLNVLYKDYEKNKTKYPWITSIDPYGDTVFNGNQWPYLVAEAEKLINEFPGEKHTNVLVAVVQFLSQKQNTPHTYLKFVGD